MKSKFTLWGVVIVSLLFVLSCTPDVPSKKQTGEMPKQNPAAEPVQEIPIKEQPNLFTLQSFYEDNGTLNELTDVIYEDLTIEQRAAQMIMSGIGRDGIDFTAGKSLVKQNKVGNILLLGHTPKSYKSIVAELNNSIENYPLLFALDAEPALINYRIKTGIPTFDKTNKLNTVFKSIQSATDIAGVLNDYNIHVNFAPVCDVALNKAVIGNRSYANTPKKVALLATAFITETQDNNIVATAKHFPGHGTVKGDSHKKLVYIDGKLKELLAFQTAIDSGVIAVMLGHIVVKNNPKYSTNGLPASISPIIIKNLLKQEMGFKGLVVSDAMTMHALDNIKDASTKAVKAGIDVVVMPPDAAKLHKNIMDLLASNSTYAHQIEKSIKKIIRLKICLGLYATPSS